MKTLHIVALTALLLPHFVSAQIYMTRNGKVSFYSKTALENIDAVNNEVFSAIDFTKSEVAFAVLVKSFHFERALMEEHFNENYMESSKIPKASFSGKFTSPKPIDLTKAGQCIVNVSGDLTIHGVTRKVEMPAEIRVSDGKVQAMAQIKVKPDDYAIQIPALVAEKIAQVIDVYIDCTYTPKGK